MRDIVPIVGMPRLQRPDFQEVLLRQPLPVPDEREGTERAAFQDDRLGLDGERAGREIEGHPRELVLQRCEFGVKERDCRRGLRTARCQIIEDRLQVGLQPAEAGVELFAEVSRGAGPVVGDGVLIVREPPPDIPPGSVGKRQADRRTDVRQGGGDPQRGPPAVERGDRHV